MTTPDQLSHAINVVRDEFMIYASLPNYAAINAGCCELFAHKVAEHLGTDLHIVGITNFMCPPQEGSPFDNVLLQQHWPDVRPPMGLEWQDMDEISEHYVFNCGTHVFIEFEKKFYDAECPEGTSSFFELPFFKRLTQRWRSMWLLKVLDAGQNLIRDPKNWAQGDYARDADGQSVPPLSKDATCWCSIGATFKARQQTDAPLWTSYAIVDELEPKSLSTFNDTHTHEEVMNLWDQTRERLKC